MNKCTGLKLKYLQDQKGGTENIKDASITEEMWEWSYSWKPNLTEPVIVIFLDVSLDGAIIF